MTPRRGGFSLSTPPLRRRLEREVQAVIYQLVAVMLLPQDTS
jgi:hypothetical protein